MSMRMQVRGGLLLVTASSAALLTGTAFAQQAADAAGV